MLISVKVHFWAATLLALAASDGSLALPEAGAAKNTNATELAAPFSACIHERYECYFNCEAYAPIHFVSDYQRVQACNHFCSSRPCGSAIPFLQPCSEEHPCADVDCINKRKNCWNKCVAHNTKPTIQEIYSICSPLCGPNFCLDPSQNLPHTGGDPKVTRPIGKGPHGPSGEKIEKPPESSICKECKKDGDCTDDLHCANGFCVTFDTDVPSCGQGSGVTLLCLPGPNGEIDSHQCTAEDYKRECRECGRKCKALSGEAKSKCVLSCQAMYDKFDCVSTILAESQPGEECKKCLSNCHPLLIRRLGNLAGCLKACSCDEKSDADYKRKCGECGKKCKDLLGDAKSKCVENCQTKFDKLGCKKIIIHESQGKLSSKEECVKCASGCHFQSINKVGDLSRCLNACPCNQIKDDAYKRKCVECGKKCKILLGDAKNKCVENCQTNFDRLGCKELIITESQREDGMPICPAVCQNCRHP